MSEERTHSGHAWRDLWRELRGEFAREREPIIIVVSAAVLLTLAWYPGYYTSFTSLAESLTASLGLSEAYELWSAHVLQFSAGLLLLVAAPSLIQRFALRRPLSDMGLRIGDWRFGGAYVVVAALVMTPLLWIGAADPALMAEYPLPRAAYALEPGNPFLWELCYLVYYIGWETTFRGFLQLGLERRVGPTLSILAQLLASVLIHMRKPFGETFSAIPGAFLLGIVTWRTRSVLWAVLLHWYIGAMTDLFCYLRM